jgi:hypothetical protein
MYGDSAEMMPIMLAFSLLDDAGSDSQRIEVETLRRRHTSSMVIGLTEVGLH